MAEDELGSTEEAWETTSTLTQRRKD